MKIIAVKSIYGWQVQAGDKYSSDDLRESDVIHIIQRTVFGKQTDYLRTNAEWNKAFNQLQIGRLPVRYTEEKT